MKILKRAKMEKVGKGTKVDKDDKDESFRDALCCLSKELGHISSATKAASNARDEDSRQQAKRKQ